MEKRRWSWHLHTQGGCPVPSTRSLSTPSSDSAIPLEFEALSRFSFRLQKLQIVEQALLGVWAGPPCALPGQPGRQGVVRGQVYTGSDLGYILALDGSVPPQVLG